MKIAILSDIHANLHALEAVLADATRRGAARFLCLGDIVGYGAQPEECVALIRKIRAASVKGNHDAWADHSIELNPAGISPDVVLGLEDTRNQLSKRSRIWLFRRPYVLRRWGVSAAHASFRQPEDWRYLYDPDDARDSFQSQPTCVAFFGHTHQAGLWREGEETFIVPAQGQAFRLSATRRCAINPGSVGNPRTPPRERDPRAQYALYDAERFEVSFLRVRYDIRACVETMRRFRLPEDIISRIEDGY